jgi:hypothetical protein
MHTPLLDLEFSYWLSLTNKLSPKLEFEFDQRINNLARLLFRVAKSFLSVESGEERECLRIYLHDRGGEAVSGEKGSISMDIWHPYYLEQFCHELGHTLYSNQDGLAWRLVYYFGHGDKNRWKIVKESTYFADDWAEARMDYPYTRPQLCFGPLSKEDAGHPWSNPTELFASSFSIYVLRPEEFVDRIIDPKTDKDAARFGKIIFLYFRDKVFNGKTFLDNDPFAGESFRDYFRTFGMNEVVDSLRMVDKERIDAYIFTYPTESTNRALNERSNKYFTLDQIEKMEELAQVTGNVPLGWFCERMQDNDSGTMNPSLRIWLSRLGFDLFGDRFYFHTHNYYKLFGFSGTSYPFQ